MSNITSEGLLDLLYNKKLPQVYRDEDSKVGLSLKRYLESLIEGGFCGSIEDIEKILLLIDPKNIPEEFFPYLCKSLGLEYFPDIGITYQRKFLMNIGEIIRRRGTFSCVQFIIRVLTGLDSELSVEGRTLNITLIARSLDDLEKIETDTPVIERYIGTHIPYYINPVIKRKIVVQIIESKSYSHSAVGYYKHYTIKKYEEGN